MNVIIDQLKKDADISSLSSSSETGASGIDKKTASAMGVTITPEILSKIPPLTVEDLMELARLIWRESKEKR